MKLTYLSVGAEMGGAERSLFDILSSVRAAQRDWPLQLITGADGPLVGLAEGLGVRAEVLPIPGTIARLGEPGAAGPAGLTLGLVAAAISSSSYASALGRSIAAFDPDVIHTNSLKMHLLGAAAAVKRRRVRPTPVVWHMHDYLGTRPTTARLLRWRRRACAAVIANSESVAGDVRSALGDLVPVTTVLNAVDLDRFSADGPSADLDTMAGLPPAPAGTVRVGLVATFGRWKGHATFLRAIAQLPQGVPVRAYVIGGALYQTEGSQQTPDELVRLAATLGVADKVGFTGFLARPEEAMRALDIVVHASTAPEPFGLVIAEAMACERAVVASNAGGAREIFTPGVDALGHEPGNVAELAAAIDTLARDAALRRRLGAAGRRSAVRRFDRVRLAGQLAPVYAFAASA